MYDTFPMHNHFHVFCFDLEKTHGLYDFKPFVEKRCRVDCNLFAHIPYGMLQCVLRFDFCKLTCRDVPERTAARRQHKASDAFFVLTSQTRENCRMFGVEGQDFSAVFFSRTLRCLPAQTMVSLFAIASVPPLLSVATAAQSPAMPETADTTMSAGMLASSSSDERHFDVLSSSKNRKANSALPPHRPEIVMRRIEFFDLFAQKRFVGISGKSDNLESVGMRANRVKHLSANRAGASEYCNRFHFILRNLRAAKAEI